MWTLIDFISSVVRRRSRPHRQTATFSARVDEAALTPALAQLDAAKTADVRIDGPTRTASFLSCGDDRRHVANVVMQARPEAAWVLSMDGDGYVRAAALERMRAPAETAARFTTIALRLNDWVPEVRAEAVRAARRVWSETPPEVAAQASPYLLSQRFLWKRWGEEEAACVDEVLRRSDVAERLTARLKEEVSGPLGRTLLQALRFPIYERGLAELATGARLPTVRAVAVKTLLTGKACWPVGLDWTWVDKSMGERRRVVVSQSRPLVMPPPSDLVSSALVDCSAMVRKAVADYITNNMAVMPNVRDIAQQLSNDRSAAVRDRADYLLRHLA